MKKYNWKYLNESFFDDIEDDIADNNIIDDQSTKQIYGIQNIEECETSKEYAQFIYDNFKLKELFNLLYNNVESIYDTTFKYPMNRYHEQTLCVLPSDIKRNIKLLYNTDIHISIIKGIYKTLTNDVTLYITPVFLYESKNRLTLIIKYGFRYLMSIDNSNIIKDNIVDELINGFDEFI